MTRPHRFVALAMLLLLLVAVPASAQEDSQQAEVTAQGYYTAPTKEALPPILVEEFPPGVVCILQPEFCSPDAQALTDPIEGVITGAEIPAGPVQPVPPGSLPVGLLGGHRRYASVLDFALPPAPENPFVERFDLILSEEGSFAVESPAFLALVRAFISQVDEQGPEPFQKFFEAVASGDAALVETEPTGIEACPIVEPWEPGENQDAANLPAYDCAFGANGERQEDGTWRFPLAFAMQAWLDGLIPFHGLYLGPVGPENLEYGDPDFSSNFAIYLSGQEAAAEAAPRYEFVATEGLDDSFGPVGGPVSTPSGPSGGGGFGGGTSVGGGSGFTPAPSNGFDDGGTDLAGAPDVAEPVPGPADSPRAAGPDRPAGEPVSATLPLQMWLLLPLGLSFAALFARAVSAEPIPVAATRAGALTKLAGEE